MRSSSGPCRHAGALSNNASRHREIAWTGEEIVVVDDGDNDALDAAATRILPIVRTPEA